MVTWPHLQYNLSHGDRILLVTSRTEVMTLKPLFQNTFILIKPRVTNFVDIIKIAIRFIKTTFKGSHKVKRIRNYVLKCNLYQNWHNIKKFVDFRWKNVDVSRTQGVRHVTIYHHSMTFLLFCHFSCKKASANSQSVRLFNKTRNATKKLNIKLE